MMAMNPIVLVSTHVLIFGEHSIGTNWWRIFIGTSLNIVAAWWVYHRVKVIEQTLINVVEARQNFYAMVTHDLKNPLTTIIMATEMGLRGEIKDLQPELEMILRQAKSMLKMIDELLISQAAKEGKLAISVGCVPVRSVLTPVLAELSPIIKKVGVTMIADVADVICLCDAGRLTQILTNLLSNSLKNTKAGGFISVTAKSNGDNVLFEVADSGGGIPKENLESIFTAYETDGKQGGYGLGLSIVKSLVEAHKGRVWAESVIGEGTKVFFTIPKHTGN
jgi:signal transduction histidine kinase